MTGYGIITTQQRRGKFLCDSILVQFSDYYYREAAAYTGVYDKVTDGTMINGRVIYLERKSRTALLAYCETEHSWTFSRWINDTDIARQFYPEDKNYIQYDPCNWFAKGTDTHTYDVTTTSSDNWYVYYSELNEVKRLVPFILECNDCMHNHDEQACNGNGQCIDNRCICNDNRFGLRCEFKNPCPTLVVDQRRTTFPSAILADQFSLLLDSNGKPVEVYDRAVYMNNTIRDGAFMNLILFNGRRWVASYFYSDSFRAMINKSNATLSDFVGFLKTSIGFETTIYVTESDSGSVLFLSEPVDLGSYKDTFSPVGLKWYETSNVYDTMAKSADESQPIDTILMCGRCSNETNKCYNKGICNSNATCECPIGFTGYLCEYKETCASGGCYNNGQCDESSGLCACKGAFYGPLCQFSYITS